MTHTNRSVISDAVRSEEFADDKTELLNALKAMAYAVVKLEDSDMDAASDLQLETLYSMADAVVEYLDRAGITMERITEDEHGEVGDRHPPHAEAVP